LVVDVGEVVVVVMVIYRKYSGFILQRFIIENVGDIVSSN